MRRRRLQEKALSATVRFLEQLPPSFPTRLMRQQLLWRHGLKPGSLPLVVASARAKKRKPPGEIESKIRVLQFLDGKRSLPRSPSYGRGMLRVKQRWSDSKGRRRETGAVATHVSICCLSLALKVRPMMLVGVCYLSIRPLSLLPHELLCITSLHFLLSSLMCVRVFATAFWHEE